ncbi:hypothetical protein LTR15_012501 [Elasticomyces elasticus]|nr:hypothetical protein LTR15_012501 [Elasticomyces elasticus]
MAAILNVLNMPLLVQHIGDAWLQQGLPQPLELGNPQERAALHAVRSNITQCFGLAPRVDRRTWIVLHFVDRLGTAGMNMTFDTPGLYRPLVQNLSVVYSLHLGVGSLAMGLTTNFNLHRPTVRSTVAQFPNLRRLQSEVSTSQSTSSTPRVLLKHNASAKYCEDGSATSALTSNCWSWLSADSGAYRLTRTSTGPVAGD